MILSAVRDPYPTRDQSEGALIRRVEPVVHSQWSDQAPLSEGQCAFFERNGFLVLPQFFVGQKLNDLQAVSEGLLGSCRSAYQDRVIVDPEQQQCRTLFGIHETEGLLRDAAYRPELLEIMRFLLDDEVYIHQSRLNFKSAVYGSGFEWHSDFETWHAEDGMPGMRAISATLLLTDEVSADGSLKFMPGSHKTFVACPGETPDSPYQENLSKQAVGKPPALFLDLLEENCGIKELVAPAGSVVLFDCNLMHGAGKSTSEHLRANAFFVYNAVSNALGSPYAAEKERPEFIASRNTSQLQGA